MTSATTATTATMDIEDLYRCYGPLVRRRARAVLGCEQAAEDALQEVFVRAIRSSNDFRAAASPRTWLYRVTMNYCLNVKRDGARRRRLLDEKVVPAMRRSDTSLDARVNVIHIMSRVPETVRNVASCFYVAGMTQDETADQLGISRRTVGNRLREFRTLAKAS